LPSICTAASSSGTSFGQVQQIDALEGFGAVVGHHLHTELPLQRRAGLDTVCHVPAVEVGVEALCQLGLLPQQGMDPRQRLPVELHQAGLAGLVDQAEGVDSEALHGPERTREAAVTHVPHDVVGRLGVLGDEVPEGVVRRLGLRDLPVRLRLRGVDQVRELDGVLDEEDRHVVADQVEVALLGVKAHREPAGIPGRVGRAP